MQWTPSFARRAENAVVAAFRPFPKADFGHPAHNRLRGFLQAPLSPAQARLMLACRTVGDDFCVEGREYYWLCRIKSNESKVWTTPAMKAVKLPTSSMRNLTTVRKLAALYPVP